MKRLLHCCALPLLVLASALAAPTPQDVDRQIRAGHYDQALVMLADVRKERPLSATADWLTASALFGKGDMQGAGTFLAAARALDPALTGAAPARVAQIEGALRGQQRSAVLRGLLWGLAALALALLAACCCGVPGGTGSARLSAARPWTRCTSACRPATTSSRRGGLA